MGALSQTDVFELKICLQNITTLGEQMRQVDARIMSRVDQALVEKLAKLPGGSTNDRRHSDSRDSRPHEIRGWQARLRMGRPSPIPLPISWEGQEGTHHEER